MPLADALAERALVAGGELYLILDQMEEYLLYHGRDGGPLALVLEDVLKRPVLPVHVLLGVRDDALADLDALKRRLPGLFGNVLRLDHLTRAAARTAIEAPLRAFAELGGPVVTATEEFVEAVLEQIAAGRIDQGLSGRGLVGEGERARRVEAPYLQLVLERLWEIQGGRGSNTLRASTLEELGGAERIVEEHLERALTGLGDEERDLAALLFDHLVTPSGTKIAHATDDLARYGRVNRGRLEPVLGTLDAARILRRVPGRSGGPPGTRSTTTSWRLPCLPGEHATSSSLSVRLQGGVTGDWPSWLPWRSSRLPARSRLLRGLCRSVTRRVPRPTLPDPVSLLHSR